MGFGFMDEEKFGRKPNKDNGFSVVAREIARVTTLRFF